MASTIQSHNTDAYYPGKYIMQGADKLKEAVARRAEAKSSGQYAAPTHKLTVIRNVLKGKRELHHRHQADGQIGAVTVHVIGGQFYTPRPYFIVELDGNEERTPTAMTSTPDWDGDPGARFVFPVFDAGSDLRVFLFNDASLDNESCKGRVIIPLRSLCTQAILPMPKPLHQATFKMMPASKQHSDDLQARYSEAVPGVPGSGMVEPQHDIGQVKLSLQLEFTAPGSDRFGLLAAYAQSLPGGMVDEGEDDDALDAEVTKQGGTTNSSDPTGPPDSRPDPKLIRLYAMRLKRCFTCPALLRSRWCLALPLVWYFWCFRLAAFQMPWVALGLSIGNGALAQSRQNDITQEMIFYEESVGEDQMPHGLNKLRVILKLLTLLQKWLIKITVLLERSRNTFNFSNPPVTVSAFAALAVACSLTSCVLLLIPLRFVVFTLGLLVLWPFFKKVLLKEGVPMKIGGAALEHDKTEKPSKHLLIAIKMLMNVLSRVPDGGDFAHEYFCSTQRV